MKCFIYWTADFKSSQIWSSQLWTQFKQLRKPEKVRTSTGSRVHPVEVLSVSGFRNCLNCVHNCDDHSVLEVMTIAVTEPAFTLTIRLILMTMTMLMMIILAMNFCDEVSPNKAQFRKYIAFLHVVGDEEKLVIRKASNQRNAPLSQ